MIAILKPLKEIDTKISNINSAISRLYNSYNETENDISTTEIIDLEFRIDMLYSIRIHLINHKQ